MSCFKSPEKIPRKSLNNQEDHLIDANIPLPVFQQNKMPGIQKLKTHSNIRLHNIKINLNAVKSFCLDQIYDSQKSVEDLKNSSPSKRDTFSMYVNGLLEQIQFLKEENQNKTAIIKILTENIDSRQLLQTDSNYLLNEFLIIDKRIHIIT